MQHRKNASRRMLVSALSMAAVGAIAQTGLALQNLPRFDTIEAKSTLTPIMSWTNAAFGLADSVGSNGATPRGGAGDAVDTWTNPAGGPWATPTNWSLNAPPTSVDDATFSLASTYGVTLPTGAVAARLSVQAGNVTLTGGSLDLQAVDNPGVGPASAANALTSLAVGNATLTLNGGVDVTYRQAYAGHQLGQTGTLNISGTGTRLHPSAGDITAAANGRFGTLGGSGTINVTAGAEVQARLFEFGRQDGANTVTVNVNTGGKLTSINATNGQVVLPRGLGATANLNFTNGGLATLVTMFTGGGTGNGNNGNLTVDGNASNVRVSNVFVTNGGSGTTFSVGTTNINVTGGGTLSLGRLNGNQDGGSSTNPALATMNVIVDGPGSTLDISNGTGFANSYIVLGQGSFTTSNMTVRNSGVVNVTDTDGDSGSGFITVASAANTIATLNVNTSGTINVQDNIAIGAGRNSVANLNLASGGMVKVGLGGQFSAANTDFLADGSSGSIATVSVTGASKLTSIGTGADAGAAFFALDRDDVANITVSGAGSEVSTPQGGMSFGGGNQADVDFTPGGGTTNLTINSGGLVSSELLILARDSGTAVGTGARTTINIDGAGSALKAIGADDPNTTGIGGGLFVTAVTAQDEFGFEIEGSGDASFSAVNINVTNGGLMDAEEASFLGDNENGSTTITVNGAGSIFDSGRQLSLNADNRSNSIATINIESGGIVRTTSSTSATSGSIILGGFGNTNTDPLGTTRAVVNLTGAGSTLSSSASIQVGGSFDENNVETLGSPAQITAGAGTVLSAAGSLDLASNSTISSAGNVAIAGVSTIGGTWTISGGADVSVGTLNAVGSGLLKLTNPTAATPTLLKTDNVLIASTAKVDVGKNAMRIRPEGVTPADTNLTKVKAFLANGRVGAGTGGITSTALAANQAVGYRLVSAAGTFLGAPVQAGDILVRTTFKGDADLNGSVVFDDLLVVAQNYSLTPTGNKDWYTGDFNFDGNSNFDDLLLLAQNYNNVLIVDGHETGDVFLTGSFEGDWAMALSLVPEPTSLTALGLASALLGRRRVAR